MMNLDLHCDYTTVGHVTIDVLEDGTRRAGGTAFYSALQAARLGMRALIITRGLAREIEQLLDPYRDELELRILPAQHTTTLQTLGAGSTRRQRVLAWAGPIAEDLALDTGILHLAPVARETPSRWRGRTSFVGLTPQGLVREWRRAGGEIAVGAPARSAAVVAERCQAIVVSEHERAGCASLIATAKTAGAVVAVTAGAEPSTILTPDGASVELEVPAIEQPGDDLGAGDVFAAAFFVALVEGQPPLQAASFANAAAAVRMRGPDASAIGGRAEIEQRLHATA
ncbi:MAG TPA: PfkB family carbohydrate kinase [Solirubrobacteraceae bacterium]|nr:PfkB family carbohydrate kinase [Solirubrobacteraceae bacterium]